mgnify:CR=1 FL=1
MSDDWDRWGDYHEHGSMLRDGVDGMPISDALKKLLNKWKKERGYDAIKNPEARYHNDKS